MVATTQGASRRAMSISARWPSCRLPIVGTHATSRPVSAARSPATAFTTCIGQSATLKYSRLPRIPAMCSTSTSRSRSRATKSSRSEFTTSSGVSA